MKVSVIIPVYNVEKYVKECLESVLNQTLEEIEIICIHDAGEDTSFQIVRKMTAGDHRVCLIENKENIGLAATRNVGLSHAHGKYIYFLDSDDKIEPDTLELLYERAERNALEVQVFGASFLFENQELEDKFHGNPSGFSKDYKEIMTGKELYIQWMKKWEWIPSQPRFFYQRKFLLDQKIRFIEGMLHEDETFTFDVLMHAKRVHLSNDKFFIRRFRTGSIMTCVPTIKNYESCILILKHLRSKKNLYEKDPELKRAVSFYMSKISENARGKYKQIIESSEKKIRPRVSVIIPVYNVEPYLEACLESVLMQTMTDIEIICVDDASADQSYSILKEYERTDPRIRIFSHEKNSGQSCGRNLGISHARGEYIYMLDADDMITSEALEELYDICIRDHLDVIGFENRQFTKDRKYLENVKRKLFTYEGSEKIFSGKDAFIHCVREDVISPSIPTFMIKRSYIEHQKLKFIEGILHEDIGFIFEMLIFAERVRFVSKAYFLRRFREHSTMTSEFTSKNMEGYLKSFLRSFELEDAIREKYGEDKEFYDAYRKWRRDIFGRIRQLYLRSEETIYHEYGGNVNEETRRIFEVLKLCTTGRARAFDILGKSICRKLEEWNTETEIYVCGDGQYANRILDALGAMDVIVKGVIVLKKERTSFRGFRVQEIAEAVDFDTPVALAVSRYQEKEYRNALQKRGFYNILDMKF